MQIHNSKKTNFSFDNNILRDQLSSVDTSKIWKKFGNNLQKPKDVKGLNIGKKTFMIGTALGIGLLIYKFAYNRG